MGAPSITISFTEKGVSAVERGERGIVALLLKDTKKTGLNVIYDITDIPDTLTDVNKSYIKKALVGYQTTPKKVIAYVMDSAATAIETEYTDALKVLKTLKFNWLAAPTAETDAMTSTITTWIKAMRGENKMVKAVLPNATGDTEGIVNVTDSLFNGNAEMTPEEVTPRIAGLIAGCPLTMSITYAPLTDYTGCTSHTTAELDTAVDAGKLVFMWDGEKVKIVRGVNSLTTKTEDKGEQFQKIKVVEIMDMVKDDIRMTAQDDYIGKYSNSYDNKLLLVTAINAYFSELVTEGLLASGTCEIDTAAQRTYLKSQGTDVEEMKDQDINEANTGSYVYLKATIAILDAMEDIVLNITI